MFMNAQIRWQTPQGEGSEALFSESLNSLVEKVSNWTPLWTAVSSQVLEPSIAGEQFSSQGAFGGESWPPLAESTLRYKERHGYPADPLIRTGRMRESFRRGGEGHIEEIEPLSLTWGSDVVSSHDGYPYPVVHQYGGGHVPARPILVMTPEMIERINVLGGAWLSEEARVAGFGVEGGVGIEGGLPGEAPIVGGIFTGQTPAFR